MIKYEELKVTIAMSPVLIGILTIILFLALATISSNFGEISISSDTIFNLLFNQGENKPLIILFVIFTITGLVSAVAGIFAH